jgi:Uma2 family endonuclease
MPGDAQVTPPKDLVPMANHPRYIDRMSAMALLTAEDLERLNLPNKRTELVRGALIVREPAGFEHGVVAARLATRLGMFVEAQQLGVVLAAETGFTQFRAPDTVRAPDVAFISTARLPPDRVRGFAELAPDLVAEVLSPGDTAGEVAEKVDDWLSAGSRLVWVVDPVRRNARVHRANGAVVPLTESDEFEGEDVVPGFTCPVADLLR